MTAAGSPRELQAQLRRLPSVDRLLTSPGVRPLLATYGHTLVARHCRSLLETLRTTIRAAEPPSDLSETHLLAELEARLVVDAEPALRRVVNATGTILHTNLGRAVLPESVVAAIALAAANPVNLEYDLEEGSRGRREEAIVRLLRELTGAESGTVVNNNAAAVFMVLNTLASGREVIVSRGELVEIGGSFRLPDIMARTGAILREVGTTNRTHPADYEQAINERTGLLLKVHPSNYRIAGFTSSVSLADLVGIGRRHSVPVMEDLGSGALVDLARYGLPKEPVVSESIDAGADVVTFSGDKLLGGPQAGLIVGRTALIAEVARNPLHRAVRCGKLTIAGMEAVLRLYRQGAAIHETLPALQALARPLGDVETMGGSVVPRIAQVLGSDFTVALEESQCQVGSGALPSEEIPSCAVAISHVALSPDAIAARFRAAMPPIIGRVSDGRFLLDLRAIFVADDVVPNWDGLDRERRE